MKSHNHTTSGRTARKQRQDDAARRQEAREDRSLLEQAALLDSRPGRSRRERDRLLGSVR